jgi:hypothetical protein
MKEQPKWKAQSHNTAESERRPHFWTAVAASFSGLVFILVSEYLALDGDVEHILLVIIKDLGIGLIVAGIVGGYYELTHVRRHMKELLMEVVTGPQFLSVLDPVKLIEYSRCSIEGIVNKKVSNVQHAGITLIDPVFEALIPALTDVYRENYDELLELHIFEKESVGCSEGKELNTMLSELGLSDTSFKDCDRPLHLFRTRLAFDIIRPDHTPSIYEWPITLTVLPVPGVALEKHVKVSVTIGDGLEEVIVLKPKAAKTEFQYLEGQKTIQVDQDRIKVQMQTIEIGYGIRSVYSSEMSLLTRGLSVVFSANREVFPESNVFGLNAREDDQPNGTRVASIVQSGLIMLPGHGYTVSWRS